MLSQLIATERAAKAGDGNCAAVAAEADVAAINRDAALKAAKCTALFRRPMRRGGRGGRRCRGYRRC